MAINSHNTPGLPNEIAIPSSFAAYAATSHAITTLEGLTHALGELAFNGAAFDHGHPDSQAIISLIGVIEEKAKGLGDLYEIEHQARQAEKEARA